MRDYIKAIEELWQIRDLLNAGNDKYTNEKKIIDEIIFQLGEGKIVVCEKITGQWCVNEWVKKAILLNFKLSEMKLYDGNCMKWYDKVDPQFLNFSQGIFEQKGFRIVPGAFIRQGAYIGKNAVVMPSFINIGAYVGDNTMIDSWATIGSCAYIGNNCHISSGAGIGGVLEPLQAKPVIIEDNCFVGAGSQIVEGMILEEGAVISTGVFIGSSTKIINRNTGDIIYGRIPAYSVVVPGVLPSSKKDLPGIYCAVIVKQVDKKTREKTSLNELLRD
jgi:2,3,4,5-tetrahydropyridine-2-carboxylate N-succinyltransferase